MLKKAICTGMHIASMMVLCVSLLIGVIAWGDLGASTEALFENHSYEVSARMQMDIINEAEIIWKYFDAKQTLGLLEKEDDSATIAEMYVLYDFLEKLGIPQEEVTILIEKYGLTKEGISAFLLDYYGISPEVREQVYQEASDGTYSTDISILDEYGYETEIIFEDEASDENIYADARAYCAYGDEMFNPDNTNLRYTITKNGEIIDSNLRENEGTDFLTVYQADSNGYELKIWLDDSYPVDDYYSSQSYLYNRFQNMKRIIGAIVIGMLVLSMFLVILLTCYAGRVKGTKEIKLAWVDRLPLELVLIFWALVAAGVVAAVVFSASNSYYESSYVWVVISTVAVALGDSLALTGYLSLVRRIKSRTLWKNSLCYMSVSGIKRIFRNLLSVTRVSQQLIVACSTYVFLMLVLCLFHTSLSISIAIIISIVGLVIVYRDAMSRKRILEGIEKITSGELDYQIDLDKINFLQMEVAESINQVGTVMNQAVNQSMKDERLKTDLITNVSHDIKTPLTSIINYVDLLKREEIQNEKAQGYLEILDQKSQRLKQLTEDLVEASKLSSGNVVLNMEKMDFNEILMQALGEFEEKFESRNLQVVLKRPEGQVAVMGEGRRIWRILENLFQNVYKYAMPGTRVYAELVKEEKEMIFTLKNISQYSLNIDADELTERFIRGDVSRTTEGSGLGLSIARDLTTLQKGGFDIHLDGDLFKAILRFELIE